jgi:hypothetical protein
MHTSSLFGGSLRRGALLGVVAQCFFIASCNNDQPDTTVRDFTNFVTVYQGAGSTQCYGGGITPRASAQVLTSAGVYVLESGCGAITGVAYPAVCGAPTGEIVLHRIPEPKLSVAEGLGFLPASTLRQSNGVDYAWVSCRVP